MQSMLRHGDVVSVCEGSRFFYRVIGPVCNLYDRSELPHPCCSINWEATWVNDKLVPIPKKGYKQPSWRRLDNGQGVGKQLIPDGASAWKGVPVYSVELIRHEIDTEEDVLRNDASEVLKELMKTRKSSSSEELRSLPRRIHILPLYAQKLEPEEKQWWYKNNHYHVKKPLVA
jgi:hypothetical protein